MRHKKRNLAERHEHYDLVLFQIADRWRLAVDTTYLQWLVQENKLLTGQAKWQSKKFFLTRNGILDYIRELSRDHLIYADVIEHVMELPEHISEFRRKQKVAAKANALTTTSLHKRKYKSSGALTQQILQEKKSGRS